MKEKNKYKSNNPLYGAHVAKKKKEKNEEKQQKPHFIMGAVRKVRGSHLRVVDLITDLTPRGAVREKPQDVHLESLDGLGHKGHGLASRLQVGMLGAVSRQFLSVLHVKSQEQVMAGCVRWVC